MIFLAPRPTCALLLLGLLVFSGPTHAQIKVDFSTTDAGVSKAIPNWGLDTNWASADNMKRGLTFMGTNNVNVVRVPAMVDKPMDNGLTSDQQTHLQLCKDLAALAGPAAKWDLCAPGSDTVNAWFQSGTGTVNVDRWVQALKQNQEFYNHPLWIVEPFNEPDYAAWGEGSMQNLSDIMSGLQLLPNFGGAAMAGGSTMNCDSAAAWYDALSDHASIGTTHTLYGTVANYVSFIQHVAATNGVPIHPEGHNVVEAIIGAEYGLNGMIWWGTAELARGDFVKASMGARLGYAEDRANWTAAAVYRAPTGAVQAFLGSSERIGGTTTYTLHATDRDVYFDGHGPQRDYAVTISRNQEKVINITWGPDVQPVIGGRYALVNFGSGLCLDVAGASTTAAAALQQNTYSGASSQQWDVTALTGIGDLSYFLITNAQSKLNADLADWAYNDEAPIKQYAAPDNAVEHWYFDYAGNGCFYIRSRWSNKCLSVSTAASPVGAAVVQRNFAGTPDQRWRLQDPATSSDLAPDGYAAGVTGGGNATPVTVTTATAFKAQAESGAAAVITVSGSLDLATLSPAGKVNVASNKTIQGLDADATVIGNLSLGTGVSNVAIRGLNITNSSGDGITLTGASNVFITHCTLFNCSGYLLNLTNGANNVTACWSEFYYTAAQPTHRYAIQIGAAAGETSPLHVTLHHNWLSALCDQFLPAATYGYVHLYDNYYDLSANTAGISALANSQLLVERNLLTNLANPLSKTGNGLIRASGNTYTGTTGTPDAGTDPVFTPGYSYELLPTAKLAATLTAPAPAAGAGNLAGSFSLTPVSLSATIADAPAAAVSPGGSFTLSVAPTAYAATGYQWRLNNRDLANATSASYAVTAMDSTTAGTYVVVLSTATGEEVVSAPAIVTLGSGTSTPPVNPPGPSSGGTSSGGGGGGGAPGYGFLSALAALALARFSGRFSRNQDRHRRHLR